MIVDVYTTCQESTRRYRHEVTVPVHTWIVQHNLGSREVNVQTISANGQNVIGAIVMYDPNIVEITWHHPTAGAAIIVAANDARPPGAYLRRVT